VTTPRRRGPGAKADEHHPTRIELLNAAVLVAERDGLAALSVEAVTREAGHAKGTFYVHFADRTDLVVQIHRRFHDRLFADIVAATAAVEPGPSRVAARLMAFLDGCRREVGVRSMLLQARSLPEIAAMALERNEQAARVLAADLGAQCRGPLDTARLLVVATVEVALRELHAGRRLAGARGALAEMIPGAHEAQGGQSRSRK
jgi:TetR/AcrR family transcriptional repressor of nem operon